MPVASIQKRRHGKLVRRPIPAGASGPLRIVVARTALDVLAGVIHGQQPAFIRALRALPGFRRFDHPIVCRPTRTNWSAPEVCTTGYASPTSIAISLAGSVAASAGGLEFGELWS